MDIKQKIRCFLGHHDWQTFLNPVTFEPKTRMCRACFVKQKAETVWEDE